MLLPAADALLEPVTTIDGFQLAGLIDASTGMVLAATLDRSDLSLPTAAAGAADIAGVLAQLTAQLAVSDELDDVMITFNDHFHVIRMIQAPRPLILLVILDRNRANLAMARLAIRNFCAGVA